MIKEPDLNSVPRGHLKKINGIWYSRCGNCEYASKLKTVGKSKCPKCNYTVFWIVNPKTGEPD